MDELHIVLPEGADTATIAQRLSETLNEWAGPGATVDVIAVADDGYDDEPEPEPEEVVVDEDV